MAAEQQQQQHNLTVSPATIEIAPAIISSERSTINSIRVRSKDCVDGGLKLMSNFGKSVNLPRNHRDDFSWDQNGLMVIKNVSEDVATLELELIACTGHMCIVRSSRQGATVLKAGETLHRLMKAGEALTLRASNAQGRGAGNL